MIEKQLRKYIIPNVLAMAGTSCYVLADTFFISASAGANGITALNLVLPVYGLISALGAMLGVGSATRYTLRKSLGSPDADDYFSNSILCTLLISLFFVAAGILCPGQILRLLGADQVILNQGLDYIRIILCFTPFFMLNYTFTAFVRNDGAPKLAMAATLSSGLFNILFDYLLMFPLGLGMTGAALATAISPIVSMSICLAHYLGGKNTIRFRLKPPSMKRLASSCGLGVAAFVGEISSGITTMVFNFVLLELAGNIAVAAYGVIANLALVGTALLNGVSQGLQPLASSVHGSGETQAEHRICRHALQIGVGIALVLVLAVLCAADQLVAIFNSEGSTALAAYAQPGIRLYFLGFPLAAVNIIQTGCLSATGQGKVSSLLSLSRGVVAIVVFAFLLSALWGITGVWLAFPASELFTLLLAQIMVRRSGKSG